MDRDVYVVLCQEVSDETVVIEEAWRVVEFVLRVWYFALRLLRWSWSLKIE